jgi:zinc D-Ala-D-Ala carboxypeptidase
MMLTPHFQLEEFYFSSTATRLGIDNYPPLEVIPNIAKCALGLEAVRALLGNPITLDSGYRCAALNKAVGGAANSAHMDGFAADFICPGFGPPLAIVKEIQWSDLEFDQCIYEGQWCHLSFAPTMRREILTAHFGPAGTTYTEGV